MLCLVDSFLGLGESAPLVRPVRVDVALERQPVGLVANGCREPVEVADGVRAMFRKEPLALLR